MLEIIDFIFFFMFTKSAGFLSIKFVQLLNVYSFYFIFITVMCNVCRFVD